MCSALQVSEAKTDGSKTLTSARTQFSLRFAPPPDCSQKATACNDPAKQGMVGAYMPNTGDSLEVRNAAVELCRGQDGLVRTLLLLAFRGSVLRSRLLQKVASGQRNHAPLVICLASPSRFPTPFAIRPCSLLSCYSWFWLVTRVAWVVVIVAAD
jgi:hypothetical protein